MSEPSALSGAPKPLPAAAWIAAAAFAVALAFTLPGWLGAASSGDPVTGTDDMVRLVRVRDLLAGQGWFDPVLHRLGVGGGTTMHWSRLVDLPIAALVLAGKALGLDGERLAALVWPFACFIAAMAGFLVAVSRAAASRDLFAPVVIGGFALAGSGVFDAGSLDHHNVQLALMIWLIAMLTPGPRPSVSLAAAGAVTALMLAIGMEALPLAVAGALAVFVRLVSEGDRFAAPARAYGLALSATLAALFLLLTPPSSYGASACDSFSLFHLAAAGTGGLALWALLSPQVSARLPAPRLVAPLAAGAAVIAVVALFFPACLADPIAQLDPDLRRFWIDQVVETQNVVQIAALDPWLLPALHALPLIALVFGIRRAAAEGWRSPLMTALIFVAFASLVTLYQMRGSQFAIPAAALALSILATLYGEGAARDRPLLKIGAIALSTTIAWKGLVLAGISLFSAGQTGPLINGAGAAVNGGCKEPLAIASLNAEPPGLVAAANSLGPSILYTTPHRVLAGPYHRDVDGNLAWIHAMTGSAAEAEAIFADAGVTLLALCPTDPDELSFRDAAPDGFAAQLMAGKIAGFLEPVASTQANPLKLFRIRR